MFFKKLKFKPTNIIILVILLLVIIPGLVFFNSYKGLWWDEAVYLGLSRSIASGEAYQINTGDELFRAPLLPVMISPFSSFGDAPVRLLLIMFGALGVLITYIFTKELYDEKTAILSSLFVATSHLLLFFGQKVLTETIFFVLFVSSLYLFYMGMEKNKKYFPFAGLLTGLCFLTRYIGIILIPIFIIYVILRTFGEKKRKDFFLTKIITKEFLLAIILLVLVLTPWLWNNQVVYNNPLGALEEQSNKIMADIYDYPFYYYFRYAFSTFGFVALFTIPAFIWMIADRKRADKLILTSVVLITIFFSLIANKEPRYLISFAPFYIFSAVGAMRFGLWLSRERLVIIVAVLFALFSFIAGVQLISGDQGSGEAMVHASLWLKDNTPQDSYVIAENYPVINYISGRKVYMFPRTEEGFYNYVDAFNISYYVIDLREPTTPEYVYSLPGNLVAEFTEPNQNVSIHKLYATNRSS